MIERLGFDQIARIAWLAGSGRTVDEIVLDSHVTADAGQIRHLLDRVNLPKPPVHADSLPLRITVPRSLVADLDDAAGSRKVSRHALAARIIVVVLKDGMVGAVLDDGVCDG